MNITNKSVYRVSKNKYKKLKHNSYDNSTLFNNYKKYPVKIIVENGKDYKEDIIPTKKLNKHTSNKFYKSRVWRELRYKALAKSNGKCCLCNRSAKDDVILHVDHIKPISKFPKLKLALDNLQVLCEDCNIGKSNKDYTDWR